MKTKCDSCQKSVVTVKGKKKFVLKVGTVTVETSAVIPERLVMGRLHTKARNTFRFCETCGPVVCDMLVEKCR